MFTNYTRYVDEFVRWGCSQSFNPDSPYIALSCAGELNSCRNRRRQKKPFPTLHGKNQMPAWHLITADGQDYTLVKYGVGPSNAKTISNLAVLRPDVWSMMRHCWRITKARPLEIMSLHTLIYAMTTFLMRFCRRYSYSEHL
ncbi:hypothetical protein ACNKHN_11700 [Shigella flexneri]